MTKEQFEERCRRELKEREPGVYKEQKKTPIEFLIRLVIAFAVYYFGFKLCADISVILGILFLCFGTGIFALIIMPAANKAVSIEEVLKERTAKYYENDAYLRYPVDYPYSFLYEGELYPFQDITPKGYQMMASNGQVNPIPQEQMLINQSTKSIGAEAKVLFDKEQEEFLGIFKTQPPVELTVTEKNNKLDDKEEQLSDVKDTTTESQNAAVQTQATSVQAQVQPIKQVEATVTSVQAQVQPIQAQVQPIQAQVQPIQAQVQPIKAVVAQVAPATREIFCNTCGGKLIVPMGNEPLKVTCPCCSYVFVYNPGN